MIKGQIADAAVHHVAAGDSIRTNCSKPCGCGNTGKMITYFIIGAILLVSTGVLQATQVLHNVGVPDNTANAIDLALGFGSLGFSLAGCGYAIFRQKERSNDHNTCSYLWIACWVLAFLGLIGAPIVFAMCVSPLTGGTGMLNAWAFIAIGLGATGILGSVGVMCVNSVYNNAQSDSNPTESSTYASGGASVAETLSLPDQATMQQSWMTSMAQWQTGAIKQDLEKNAQENSGPDNRSVRGTKRSSESEKTVPECYEVALRRRVLEQIFPKIELASTYDVSFSKTGC